MMNQMAFVIGIFIDQKRRLPNSNQISGKKRGRVTAMHNDLLLLLYFGLQRFQDFWRYDRLDNGTHFFNENNAKY